MKHQYICEPWSGKLVCQIPKGVTFLDNLNLGHLRDCWKGITEEHHNEKLWFHPLAMMYPKHDPRWRNTNSFLNPEVVSWYVNFLGA